MSLRRTARAMAPAALVLAVSMLAALGLTGTAFAHATLIGSDPADGAVLPTAPSVVTLTFDDNLEDFQPTVVVTGPDGNQYQSGSATIDGAKLSSAVAPLTVAGAYTIAYRVVSDDGHPVEGQVHFEFAAAPVTTSAARPSTPATAGTSAPTTSAAPRPSAQSSAVAVPTVTSDTSATSSSSSGWTAWQWAAVVVFVIIAFVAALVLRRRMKANARAQAATSDGDDTLH